MTDLDATRRYMREQAIDGWLLYDFRGSNPVFWHLLGTRHPTSRRNFIFIPLDAEPAMLIHELDHQHFDGTDFRQERYTSWPQMQAWLRAALKGRGRIAMEYSPGGAIPMHSYADAGTVEMVRGLGAEVVSSANLFQVAAAAWPAAALASHLRACEIVQGVKDAAFTRIAAQLRSGEAVSEYSIQQFIREQFDRHGLVTDHGPIVAVNSHSGDPHYEPTEASHALIQQGDWVLIDLWAKEPDNEGIYCDITWCGYAGSDVPAKHQEVFDTVLGARDAAIDFVQHAWREGATVQGWQADDAARNHITEAGYGDFFIHRTGHSMGPSPTPHALGVNLDNLETHDTRDIIPGVGFSVEPGIYLPAFGVRSEIDMYVDPNDGPVVTTEIQREVIRLL